MLVYFMTTSSLERSEAELSCPAGGSSSVVADPLPAVDEQRLQIDAEGLVLWNGSTFAPGNGGGGLGPMEERLRAFRETSAAAGSEASVAIRPAGEAPHQVLIHLLDSLSRAGIERLRLE